MKIVIDRANRRIVNSLAKKYNLVINWHPRDKKPAGIFFDSFDIDDHDNTAFYNLRQFKKELTVSCEKRAITINFGLMDQVLEHRAKCFYNKHNRTFSYLKSLSHPK